MKETPEVAALYSGVAKVLDTLCSNGRRVGDVQHKVKVSPEMMDDIVRPLWNSVVVVRGMRRGNTVTLTEIDPA